MSPFFPLVCERKNKSLKKRNRCVFLAWIVIFILAAEWKMNTPVRLPLLPTFIFCFTNVVSLRLESQAFRQDSLHEIMGFAHGLSSSD